MRAHAQDTKKAKYGHMDIAPQHLEAEAGGDKSLAASLGQKGAGSERPSLMGIKWRVVRNVLWSPNIHAWHVHTHAYTPDT